MQTKRTIIPAGTPGTFRPEWGQFPEATARIDVWEIYPAHSNSGQVIRYTDQLWADTQDCYAWSYAPSAPPADGLEAFKTKWDLLTFPAVWIGDVMYHYIEDSQCLTIGNRELQLIGRHENISTLAAAQEAAYAHFLSTLND